MRVATIIIFIFSWEIWGTEVRQFAPDHQSKWKTGIQTHLAPELVLLPHSAQVIKLNAIDFVFFIEYIVVW